LTKLHEYLQSAILLSKVTNYEMPRIEIRGGRKRKISNVFNEIDLKDEKLVASKLKEKGSPTEVKSKLQTVDVEQSSKDDTQK